MIELVVKCAASYLLGSLMGGLIVGRLCGGVDIRKLGSGNAGGTNALRTQGWVFAFWVMLIDIGKGFVATAILAPAHPFGAGLPPSAWHDWLPIACGIAAILGHIYPVGYGFRGGKGVATVIGAVLGINAWLLLPVLLTWLVFVALSGYVGLGSMAASASLPAYVAWSGIEPLEPLIVFGVVVTVLIVYTHRSNIGAHARAYRAARATLVAPGPAPWLTPGASRFTQVPLSCLQVELSSRSPTSLSPSRHASSPSSPTPSSTPARISHALWASPAARSGRQPARCALWASPCRPCATKVIASRMRAIL